MISCLLLLLLLDWQAQWGIQRPSGWGEPRRRDLLRQFITRSVQYLFVPVTCWVVLSAAPCTCPLSSVPTDCEWTESRSWWYEILSVLAVSTAVWWQHGKHAHFQHLCVFGPHGTICMRLLLLWSSLYLYILNTVRCQYVRLSVTLGVASSVANDVIVIIAGLWGTAMATCGHGLQHSSYIWISNTADEDYNSYLNVLNEVQKFKLHVTSVVLPLWLIVHVLSASICVYFRWRWSWQFHWTKC